MRTTISLSVTPQVAIKTRRLARKRGFPSVSEYVRFLISADDEVFISEDELLQRSREAHRLHKSGKLIQANSLKDLLA